VKLSRRDALVALGATTLGAAGVGYGPAALAEGSDEGPATPGRIDATTAMAEVVYPPAVSVDEGFVRTQVFGRPEPLDGHFRGLADAIDTVEEFSASRFDAPVAALSRADRRQLLTDMGVNSVRASCDGTVAERVRYYLVGDLLYALFTHPRGGRLLGIPNPSGYPGGSELYRRGPDR
jgi:hypothetical protein